MPHRNTIRHFTENGIYHVYNRGVEKRDIFLDEQDYAVFLHLLKYYLSPTSLNNTNPWIEFQNFKVARPRPLDNIETEVELIAFCLMPNHFHLLVKQLTIDGVTKLLRRIATTYAIYFNKRYNRIGYLFQGPYKAALIETDNYLLHVSRYIHQNPAPLTRRNLVSYPYSSYKYYIGRARANWIKPNIILSYFNRNQLLPLLKHYPSYEEFVENSTQNSDQIIGNLKLE